MRTTNRRKFIGELLTASTVAGLSSSVLGQSSTDVRHSEDTNTLSCPPYLQSLMPTAVHIFVMTTKKSVTHVVLKDENGIKREIYQSSDGLIEANKTLFSFYINNLKPHHTYHYEVVSKEIVKFKPYAIEYGPSISSPTFMFTTPSEDAEQVSCLILNDLHDRAQSFAELFKWNRDRSFDFTVLNGDIFNHLESEKQLIENLFVPIGHQLKSSKPFILNRGNHETRGLFAREFHKYFASHQQRYYQAFRQGPVFWTFLDTGEDKPDNNKEYSGLVSFDQYREEQAKWFEEKVVKTKAFKNASFRVVIMHIPPFYSGDWHGTMHCRELFTPLFNKYGVDLVISGHTHVYSVNQPNSEHRFPIVIGGSPKDGKRTIIHLSATKKQLELNMNLDTGDLVGELKLTT